MHGVKREKPTAASEEARLARKSKEAVKLAAYKEIESKVFQAKKDRWYDDESLQLTTNILTLNPELYTVWNFRRTILLHIFGTRLPRQASSHDIEGSKDIFSSLRESPSDSPSASSSSAGTKGKEFSSRDVNEAKRSYLETDLELTEHALRAHPKVYWIWNHRLWCLEELPQAGDQDPGLKWKVEMGLVDKMLQLDPRNFHGWDYRRTLTSRVASLMREGESERESSTGIEFPRTLSELAWDPEVKALHLELAKKELDYALRKIESNFSNFSAWHQRSKLLPRVWDARGLDEDGRKQERIKELELVKQAMYTDPSDQSVWIYHSWLIEQVPSRDILEEEIQAIEELLELEPDSKWCMQSLANYKVLLSKFVGSEGGEGVEENLLSSARSHLEKLKDIDPDRRARYQYLLDNLGRGR
ncbi:protein prenylyltransferase [Violaceomyces palustris]|uniref:Protein prenylyltransferase n=1 Tax=Violaceomyces palustris TaxID=1673888 RepID=A0ACD0NNV8_9BASI|nr:protein prenylyltransferase [Violaceomyces palustris]